MRILRPSAVRVKVASQDLQQSQRFTIVAWKNTPRHCNYPIQKTCGYVVVKVERLRNKGDMPTPPDGEDEARPIAPTGAVGASAGAAIVVISVAVNKCSIGVAGVFAAAAVGVVAGAGAVSGAVALRPLAYVDAKERQHAVGRTPADWFA